ncbi:uncharacterized protein N7483_012856 [Penicillium malachiteum]|uniref:uncharacterized protein n=1 Tax=Penicillium malachiteum TaxID=1324776 RepID=UPI002546C65E|nr:uncharacterized protein N7483_012856 [Penicillium malachiteum]KAJ5715675.1 hypothetical protein N7483_012856 [Penicillium malachiteum]
MPAYSEEDIASLPPAIRRKFFSNVERLRMRLDQDAPGCSTSDHARVYRSNSAHGPSLHSRGLRTPPGNRRRGLEKRITSPKKLRKPGSLQSAYLIAQADSQCFHALPAKVQQKLFSPEERRRLRLAYRESVILDAADEAFYRDSNSRRRLSTDSLPSLPSETSLLLTTPPRSFGNRIPIPTFRWLDGDGDLDLSLDEYHAHIADAAIRKAPRRRTSFRRSLSFSTYSSPKHRQTASVPPQNAIPRSIPPSQSLPPFGPLLNHNPSSRPGSRNQSSHAPKSSTSSMDPSAQYYQDPDARLKLRVYLASPQKFDEAIEFGFPALDQNKENMAPETHSPSISMAQEYAGTFFEDDDGTMVGSPGGSVVEEPALSMASQMRETPRPSVDTPSLLQRRQSFLPASRTGPQRLPGNREMTLKMTLTRPDLRTESPTSSPSSEDPLRLAALPPADRNQHLWDDLDDEQSVVKKMWRKLRRRA